MMHAFDSPVEGANATADVGFRFLVRGRSMDRPRDADWRNDEAERALVLDLDAEGSRSRFGRPRAGVVPFGPGVNTSANFGHSSARW